MDHTGLIVIHGKRCTGNTTLANHIAEKIDGTVFVCCKQMSVPEFKNSTFLQNVPTDHLFWRHIPVNQRKVLIIEDVSMYSLFRNQNFKRFICTAHHHNATVILVTVYQIPASLACHVKYLYLFTINRRFFEQVYNVFSLENMFTSAGQMEMLLHESRLKYPFIRINVRTSTFRVQNIHSEHAESCWKRMIIYSYLLQEPSFPLPVDLIRLVGRYV